jgi:hypothetical protein
VSVDLDRLYALLPAIYQLRDAELAEGRAAGPLRTLLAPIAAELAVLEASLEQLADDPFIETCAEWVVPYIGELLGVRGLRPFRPGAFTQRVFVADTVARRRRKGTAAILEQLARDVTDWDARVVEFFERLVMTQSVQHVRPQSLATASLRRQEPLDRVGTAFDPLAHTVDVRSIARRRGRFNIPNVGIFLWRLRAYPLTDSPAVGLDGQRFLFSPLGNDAPLFTSPVSDAELTELAEPIDVPEPLRRRALADALDDGYVGPGLSIALRVDGRPVPDPDARPPGPPSARLRICNLSDRRDAAGNVIGWGHLPAAGDPIALDPELGRLAFPPDALPSEVRVSFHYGFSADLGGGEYARRLDPELAPHATIQAALDAVAAGGGSGLVEIDRASRSGRYAETPLIRAGATDRVVVRAADGSRPTLVLGGDLRIEGGDVTLSGLLVVGGRLRVGASVRRLRLEHCTLVPGLALSIDGAPAAPGAPSLILEEGATETTAVEIDHCVVGALRLPAEGATLAIRDSVVDAHGQVAIAADDADSRPGPPTTLERVTLLGSTHVRELTLADAVIFAEPVRAVRRQAGCVRFSFVPEGSRTPRRYHSQPDLAVGRALKAARAPGPAAPGAPPAADPAQVEAAVRARLRPGFVARAYGRPAYAQLAPACPDEIRAGAEDEAEMGAFHDLFQPQREANLRAQLDEYLRFGLEAGVLYAT